MENQQLADTMNDVVINNIAGQAPVSHGSSVFDVFWHSGLIVKFVILSLVLASIWSWTIIISKHIKMKQLKMDANVFENNFWSGTSLESLYHEIRNTMFDPMSNVFCAAMAEWDRITKKGQFADLSFEQKLSKISQIKQIMNITINKEIEDIEKNMTFIANLGNNGVIVGILGMVVSIMDGMKTIGINQSAGMAAVAPILSEALFSTALALFAAIPAAIAYRKISSDINKYVNRLETFADEFSSIIARQLDND